MFRRTNDNAHQTEYRFDDGVHDVIFHHRFASAGAVKFNPMGTPNLDVDSSGLDVLLHKEVEERKG